LLIAISAVAVFPAFAKGPQDTAHDVTGNYAVYGTGNTGPLVLPSAGMGSIVLVNYDGAGEPLMVDFNDIDYVIPASTQGQSGVWNHVEISLAPGIYDYTASVPGIGTVTRSVDVVAGKVTSLGFLDNPNQTNARPAAGALLYFEGDMTAQAQ
jgi:hypothetical protein